MKRLLAFSLAVIMLNFVGGLEQSNAIMSSSGYNVDSQKSISDSMQQPVHSEAVSAPEKSQISESESEQSSPAEPQAIAQVADDGGAIFHK